MQPIHADELSCSKPVRRKLLHQLGQMGMPKRLSLPLVLTSTKTVGFVHGCISDDVSRRASASQGDIEFFFPHLDALPVERTLAVSCAEPE